MKNPMIAAVVAALPQIFFVLIILAAVGVLAATGHLGAQNADQIILLVVGATGVAAGIVLGSSQPNGTLVVHGIIAVAILGLSVVLTLRNVLSEAQIVGIISVLIGSAVIATGSNAMTVASRFGGSGAMTINHFGQGDIDAAIEEHDKKLVDAIAVTRPADPAPGAPPPAGS